jgi:hypothetical protein
MWRSIKYPEGYAVDRIHASDGDVGQVEDLLVDAFGGT